MLENTRRYIQKRLRGLPEEQQVAARLRYGKDLESWFREFRKGRVYTLKKRD